MRLALVAAVACLLMPAPASAVQAPGEILPSLAANQTHSWVDDSIGFDAMMADYQAGERLYVTCGNVAEIGRRLLRDAGYPARVVQTITLGEFNEMIDGHMLLEVFDEGRWQLWDLDANVRAVDEHGAGVSVVDQVAAVRAGTAQWEQIATDPLYRLDEPDPVLRDLAAEIFGDPAMFYERVMGIPLLPRDPEGTVNLGMYFNDRTQISRLGAYKHGWRFLATDEQWMMLTTSTDAPAIPVPVSKPKPKPAPIVPAPVIAPDVTPQATAAGARVNRLKRRYRRTHTRTTRQRYRQYRVRTRSLSP